ncbi:signal peptidase I [Planotetraspora mira]|uniref:signal peptidase I n=1 Tax=Planotetraspora mira TaxID=58121 RepID=UPI0023B292B0|nr:signal peptidase I [Planotetraspora mira]
MNSRGLSALIVGLITFSATGCGVAYRLTGREAFDIPGISMEPTIKKGERVVAHLTDGDYAPHEGDVIVYKAPPSWSNGNQSALRISRVIGTPEVDVRCCDDAGHLDLDGKPLSEPYLATRAASAVDFDVVVPPGRLWVMGDSRDVSMDSRAHLADSDKGTISVADVVGVVDVPDRAG